MATTALIPVEEYLSTSYTDGDREYVDGEVLERNVGERNHARLQLLIASFLNANYGKFWSATECRVRMSPTRFRIPDICLATVRPGPEDGPLTDPPFLAIEVLSPDDRASDLEEKIRDYLACGVKFVWVINSRTRAGFVYTSDGMREAKDGVLRTEDPCIELPLANIFEDGSSR